MNQVRKGNAEWEGDGGSPTACGVSNGCFRSRGDEAARARVAFDCGAA